MDRGWHQSINMHESEGRTPEAVRTKGRSSIAEFGNRYTSILSGQLCAREGYLVIYDVSGASRTGPYFAVLYLWFERRKIRPAVCAIHVESTDCNYTQGVVAILHP